MVLEQNNYRYEHVFYLCTMISIGLMFGLVLANVLSCGEAFDILCQYGIHLWDTARIASNPLWAGRVQVQIVLLHDMLVFL